MGSSWIIWGEWLIHYKIHYMGVSLSSHGGTPQELDFLSGNIRIENGWELGVSHGIPWYQETFTWWFFGHTKTNGKVKSKQRKLEKVGVSSRKRKFRFTTRIHCWLCHGSTFFLDTWKTQLRDITWQFGVLLTWLRLEISPQILVMIMFHMKIRWKQHIMDTFKLKIFEASINFQVEWKILSPLPVIPHGFLTNIKSWILHGPFLPVSGWPFPATTPSPHFFSQVSAVQVALGHARQARLHLMVARFWRELKVVVVKVRRYRGKVEMILHSKVIGLSSVLWTPHPIVRVRTNVNHHLVSSR